jgi:beta-glucosidase
LFDNPYTDENLAEQNINRKDFRELNRQVAREGIVLLENKNKTLPLSRDLTSIAVIGPNANKAGNQLGSYTFMYQRDEDVVTVLEGIKNAVNENTEIHYSRGCGIKDLDKTGFANAINIARKSDLVVLVIGGSSSGDFDDIKFDPNTGSMISTFEDMTDIDCGEGNDKSDLGLSGVQKELFDELKKTNKPVVVVYINGRPISEPEISEKADALVEAWYCGWEGGNAVADILFGKYNPSGKLSISIPFNASQLPVFYNNLSEPRRNYIDQSSAPLYPFGYGLSYTEFEYTDLQLPETFKKNEDLTISVKVKNTGEMDGDAVVQLYVKDLNSSVVTPVKELKAFKKAFVKKGETKNVNLIIPFDELALYNINMKKVVEPGEFEIMIGKSSSEIVLKKRITLLEN